MDKAPTSASTSWRFFGIYRLGDLYIHKHGGHRAEHSATGANYMQNQKPRPAILMLAFCIGNAELTHIAYYQIKPAAKLVVDHTTVDTCGDHFYPAVVYFDIGKELDLSAYAAFIIVADFLFEYQQIQRGLFGILVRELACRRMYGVSWTRPYLQEIRT
ncbi:hypothetical protein BSLG_006623 [Batrachochytrium salamandrivorans]|nr:hypothetical protein BSLG_006623 [Batrachochytrium salamandrivorans]